MAEAVIVGGGPAGLAAALFAARRGHKVTVLERDAPPAEGSAEDDFAAWPRKGVAHARQGHVFLARSTQILRQEATDVLAAILSRGAVESPLGLDDDAANILARRLVYEGALRRVVELEPGVTILSGITATGLRVSRTDDGVPRVVGVRTTGREDLLADLVVDASGRRSCARAWLREIGAQPPLEISQGCGFFYVTRHYRLREGESFPSTELPIITPLDYMTVLAFPCDNGRFQLTSTVAVEEPYRHRMLNADVFDRFLTEVPLTRPWLQRGEPVSEPQAMGRIENRRTSLVRDGRPVAAGFALLGDASMQTNPTTGRGISLAFAQAQQLARTLEQAKQYPLGFVAEFEAWTAKHLGVWFKSQVAIDDARLKQLRAALKGESRPPSAAPTNRLIAALAVLRHEDPLIRDASIRLYNLLMTPEELMADRGVTRRVIAYLRAHPVIDIRPEGPDRATFEHIVST